MDWYSMTNSAIEQEIGKRIKKERLKRNMTQLELGRKTGLSRVSISKIESGKGSSLSSILEILRMLNLLHFLDNLFPSSELSPLEILKIQNKEVRHRARRSTKP